VEGRYFLKKVLKMDFRRGVKAHEEFAGRTFQTDKSGSKGRNKDLVAARNHCLIHRYYYYAKLLHFTYEAVVTELQKEFFLSADTIPRIVEKHMEQIKQIGANNVTAPMLEAEFPFLKWKHKAPATKIKIPAREVYNRY
jgi:hypothetical protein